MEKNQFVLWPFGARNELGRETLAAVTPVAYTRALQNTA